MSNTVTVNPWKVRYQRQQNETVEKERPFHTVLKCSNDYTELISVYILISPVALDRLFVCF